MPAEQITSELSDLIGSDFEPSFVSWLFAELEHHYPDPNAGPSSSSGHNSGVVSDSHRSPENDSQIGRAHV